jgi:hypothetical protein
MRSSTPLRVAAILAAIPTALAGGIAHSATVAGWDFSQWSASGTLSTNGTTLTNVLSANYSSLDPTQNAGAESAAFGRLFFNGQFGSIAIAPVGNGSEAFTPASGSLNSNLDAPALDSAGNPILGANPFDSLQVLLSEQQQFASRLRMVASGAAQVVFSADLTTVPQTGNTWVVTFGAQADSASNLGIDFSADGTSYAVVTSVALTTGDTRFQIPLSAATSERAFVRFRFSPPTGGAQFIDNVSVEATLSGGSDTDGDGIPNASDRCPLFATADQTDTDGDGRGNACECSDQNLDGRNTVADLVAINQAIFNPALVTPLCDGNNDGNCSVADMVAANQEIFSPTSTSTCSRQPVPGP